MSGSGSAAMSYGSPIVGEENTGSPALARPLQQQASALQGRLMCALWEDDMAPAPSRISHSLHNFRLQMPAHTLHSQKEGQMVIACPEDFACKSA